MHFFHLFRSIDGTNAAAERRILLGDDEERALVAERQTKGRGKGGRLWVSEEGSAAITFVTQEKCREMPPGLISVIAAVALCDTVRAYFPASLARRVCVKWPNDLYVGDAKLAGILCKNFFAEEKTTYVAGFGINLSSAPLNMNATSLKAAQGASGVSSGPLVLAESLREKWAYFFTRAAKEGKEMAVQEYSQREYSPVGRATYAGKPVISAKLCGDGALELGLRGEEKIVVTDSDAICWSKAA